MSPKHEPPHEALPGFRLRDAEVADAPAITRVWYASFYASHKFWEYATPYDAVSRKWFDDLWIKGIEAGPDVIRTLVLEDLSRGGRIVAFCRAQPPQEDGNMDLRMPAFPDHWDEALTDGCFGGMARCREAIMGRRPHWSESNIHPSCPYSSAERASIRLLPICYLKKERVLGKRSLVLILTVFRFTVAELIGIDEAYQNRRLAAVFVDWLFRSADGAGLDLYADASPRGYAIWKHYGWEEQPGPTARINGRLGQFETYELVPILRRPGKGFVSVMAKL
jgi:hypothetical protein